MQESNDETFSSRRKMVDPKRIVFLLILALAVGLVIVFLRTRHYQAINQLVQLESQQQQWNQKIWQQRLELSYNIESPEQLKRKLEELKVRVFPPGTDLEEIEGELEGDVVVPENRLEE